MSSAFRRWIRSVSLLLLAACTPGASGETCPDACTDGFTCRDGECRELCNQDRDCPGIDALCREGACEVALNAECTSDSECTSPGPCQIATGAACIRGGICTYGALPVGTACDDNSLCTTNDQCDGAGACTGVQAECNTPPANECLAGNELYRVYANPGVCQISSGDCSYASVDTTCLNCAQTCSPMCAGVVCSELNGGCQSNGLCDSTNPGVCSYDRQPDGASCDLTGAPVGSGGGVCKAGLCVDCLQDGDCSNLPTGDPICFAGACSAGVCQYIPQPGIVCALAGCVAGSLNNERLCVGNGSCPDTGGSSCGGLRCTSDGSACLSICTTNDDCLPGSYCDSGGTCPALLADGADCSVEGSDACLSGYCDGALCCAGSNCCLVAGDCAASFDVAPTCDVTGAATDCQGRRSDKACVNNVCTSQVVDDDTACTGLAHTCAADFAPWLCTGVADQPTPQCLSVCTLDNECRAGFVCSSGSCIPRPGVGNSCPASTCLTGLKCENVICCDIAGPTCCTTDGECLNGLACDTSISSCFVTCNNYDAAACANSSTDYCLSNACVPLLTGGVACVDNGECSSGQCVEGVCCPTACNGTCESCRDALTGQGDGVCATILAGVADTVPADSCTAGGQGCGGTSCACDGSGNASINCRLAVGQDCTSDTDCASSICECADTQCSMFKCAVSRCGVCQYTATGSACLGGLGGPGPVDDPQDCTGVSSCYAGLCSLDTGQACITDSACGLGNCECGDATCTVVGTLCSDTACSPCEFTSSGTTCDGDLAATMSCDDGDACTTTDACSGGLCVGSDPVQCNTSPGQCYLASGLCDPFDATCSYGVKAAGTPCDDSNANTENDVCDGAGLCAGTSLPCLVHVDGAAGAGGDGTSWATAYASIQAGIDQATTLVTGGGDICSVWVAQGVYEIYQSSLTDTLQLAPWIHVYGGFAGVEQTLAERVLGAFPTVLDGLNSSYHVVTGAADTVFDGFTVRNGNAPAPSGVQGRGAGGFFVDADGAIIANTVFSNNVGRASGGGLRLTSSAGLLISNCVFVENHADTAGGGLFIATSIGVRVEDCIFSRNETDGYGGGILSWYSQGTIITRSVFSSNTAASYGGGHNTTGESANISSSVFVTNQTNSNGSAIRTAENATAIVERVTVVGNTGGADLHDGLGGRTTLNSGIVWTNGGSAQINIGGGTTYSNVKGGTAGTGNIDSDPMFRSNGGGTWSAAPQYDPDVGQTMLTDSAATMTPGSLVGQFVELLGGTQHPIAMNTGSVVVVWGDVTGIATSGDAYVLHDYRLQLGSPSIDTGDPGLSPDSGLGGNFPVCVDGTGAVVGTGCPDMGAYEYEGN